MHTHGVGAAILALFFLLFCATTASADIVDLSNGVRAPKKRDMQTGWGEFPSDADLDLSKGSDLKLTYDAFEIGSTRGDAGQVVTNGIYITSLILKNTEYQAGEQHASRGFWNEAAQAFAAAAESETGTAKQVALYKYMLAATGTGNTALTLRAANAVLESDPKTYYFGPAQETRARAFATEGQLGNALGSLKRVMDAPRMNARDYFSAAYMSVWLSKFIRAKSAEAYAEAEKAFQGLLRELERHPRRQLAAVPRLKIMMSLAASIRAQGRMDEAKEVFQKILEAAGETTDASVLAGVYYGLGDVAFEEASAVQKKVKAQPSLKEKVKGLLDTAALHYLRVILLYKESADNNQIFGATRGVASVFASLFALSGDKDCELADRSYRYYRQAVDMQPQGEARRLLVLEGKVLKKRMDEACKEEEKE